jgi:hypothetical protein
MPLHGILDPAGRPLPRPPNKAVAAQSTGGPLPCAELRNLERFSGLASQRACLAVLDALRQASFVQYC